MLSTETPKITDDDELGYKDHKEYASEKASERYAEDPTQWARSRREAAEPKHCSREGRTRTNEAYQTRNPRSRRRHEHGEVREGTVKKRSSDYRKQPCKVRSIWSKRIQPKKR